MVLIFSLMFALLTLTAVVAQKTYAHIPARELKRRASRGDEIAQSLYQVVAYGLSLDILLWLAIGLTTVSFVVVFSRGFSAWLAFFGGAALLWFAFGWITKARPGNLSFKLAKIVAPPMAWLLNKFHPLFDWALNIIKRRRPVIIHTGLFEIEDLVELLQTQKAAANNRMDQTALNIAARALTFGDKLVREVMTPKRMIRYVKQNESIGPILMNELHANGHSRFPVVGDAPDKIIGTLYIHDLLGKPLAEGGTVKEVMSHKVYYVQEEQDLWHGLDAFLKTNHHLFIVVNNFEEVVGVISIEDILEQIIGERIVDEFDRFDDLRAVAQLEAARDRQQNAETVVK